MAPDKPSSPMTTQPLPIRQIETGSIGRYDALTNENFEPDDEALIFLNGDNEQTCHVEGPNAKAMARQIVAAVTSYMTPAAPGDVAEPVRCLGCGSAWTDADLKAAQAADPKIISCCPEREPLTIIGWMARSIAAEARARRSSAEIADRNAKAFKYLQECGAQARRANAAEAKLADAVELLAEHRLNLDTDARARLVSRTDAFIDRVGEAR